MTKRKVNLKTTRPLAFLLLLIYECSLVANTQVSVPNPRNVSPQEVPSIIKAIPSYTRFGYSGLAFLDGKLYASSNIGLLEYERGTLSRLYKWYDRDDVISGPWVDRADHSLWLFHNGINKLIRFDGKSWNIVDLPRPKEGYTRGDMLKGFQGISTDTAFWLQGGNHAWRWDASKDDWVSESIPDTGLFISIAPVKDKTLILLRHRYVPYLAESPLNRRDKPDSDTVYFIQDGQWHELPNTSGIKFFTKETLVAKEAVYILTESNNLLRLNTSEIVPIEIPGKVEAMTVTSSGNLLVSFRNKGIYEYSDGWHKRFQSPYAQTEADHWVYLSEYNGQIALAIVSKPKMAGEGKWKYPGQTTLWLSSGSILKAVPLG